MAVPVRVGGRVGPAGGAHQAAHGLADDVVARALGIGAVVAKAGNRAVDDGGVDFFQIFIAKAQLFHHAGAVVFQHNVRLLHQLAENLFALLAFQVQRHAALVAVQVHEIGAFAVHNGEVAARIVAAARQLNFRHLGAHVCQHHAAVGARQHARKVQYFYSVQQTCHDKGSSNLLCAAAARRGMCDAAQSAACCRCIPAPGRGRAVSSRRAACARAPVFFVRGLYGRAAALRPWAKRVRGRPPLQPKRGRGLLCLVSTFLVQKRMLPHSGAPSGSPRRAGAARPPHRSG